MKSQNLDLLARAGEELSILLEITTGYPDNPDLLLRANPEAAAVVTEIFQKLLKENARIPATVANCVVYLQTVRNVLKLQRRGEACP